MEDSREVTALVQTTFPRAGFKFVKACVAAIAASIEHNSIEYAIRHAEATSYIESDRAAVLDALRIMDMVPCGNPECPIHGKKPESSEDPTLICLLRQPLPVVLHRFVSMLESRSARRAERIKEVFKDILADPLHLKFHLVLGEAIGVVLTEIEHTLPKGWKVDAKEIDGKEWYVITKEDGEGELAVVARDLQA